MTMMEPRKMSLRAWGTLASFCGVTIRPGRMQLQRMFCLPYCWAVYWVRMSTPALAQA